MEYLIDIKVALTIGGSVVACLTAYFVGKNAIESKTRDRIDSLQKEINELNKAQERLAGRDEIQQVFIDEIRNKVLPEIKDHLKELRK